MKGITTSKSKVMGLSFKTIEKRIRELESNIKEIENHGNRNTKYLKRLKAVEEKVEELRFRLNAMPDIKQQKNSVGFIFKKTKILPLTEKEKQLLSKRKNLKDSINKAENTINDLRNRVMNKFNTKAYIDMIYQLGIYREAYNKKEKEQRKIDKLIEVSNSTKSLAEANKKKTRRLADNLKIVATENCPYCGKNIDTPHKDHIYPVSKGGLSTERNLVIICSDCNQSKSDMTLNSFINKFKDRLLSREQIESNLIDLGKEF